MSSWLTVDRLVGLVLLIVSILFCLQAWQLINDIAPIFRNNPMRLDTMPKIIGVVAIIASLITIFMPLTSLRESNDSKVLEAKEKLKEEISFANIGDYAVGQLAAMIALMCVYTLVLRPLGFIPSTVGFLFLGSLLLGERRWVGMVLVSIIAPSAIWLLVTYVLERKIPAWPSF